MDRSTKLLLLAVIIAVLTPLTLVMVMLEGAADASELMAQALLLTAMVPLIVLSAYMWATGKGAMLIAGYNTSPKAVRDRYDPTALTRFVGKVMTISMLIMLVGLEALVLIDNTALFFILLATSLAILFSSIYYMNTGNRFLREGASPSSVLMTSKDRKRNRTVMLAALAVTAIILIAVFAFIGSGSVQASLEADGLQVKAPVVSEHILYEDITMIELRDSFDNGRRVGGFGGTEVSSGNFENGEFGKYVLARYNSVESCIIVHHSGGVMVFNLESVEETTRLYDEMRSQL